MKIAVLNSQVLYTSGGAEHLADALVRELRIAGHQAELIRIPFQPTTTAHLLAQVAACRLIRLPESIDLVIPIRFPAYCVPYARKKLWLCHQQRAIYDLWDTQYSPFREKTAQAYALRDAVIHADTYYLKEVEAVYTISNEVTKRLEHFNHFTATGVLYPPLVNPSLFHRGKFGDYFFYPSRYNGLKRQNLVLEAMRYIKTPLKLILAGEPERDKVVAALDRSIIQYNLQDRVRRLGYIPDTERAQLMANALGILFTPFREDYGYVTIEAFLSGKPVITTTDSGGPTELVKNGFNGFIVEPTPQSLAQAMDQLWENKQEAQAMGEHAYESVTDQFISWHHIIKTLIS